MKGGEDEAEAANGGSMGAMEGEEGVCRGRAPADATVDTAALMTAAASCDTASWECCSDGCAGGCGRSCGEMTVTLSIDGCIGGGYAAYDERTGETGTVEGEKAFVVNEAALAAGNRAKEGKEAGNDGEADGSEAG